MAVFYADAAQALLKNPLMREAYIGELIWPRHATRQLPGEGDGNR